MSEMEPQEDYEEELVDEDVPVEEELRTKDEQGARPFFALVSFLIAVVCLSVFITRSLDIISGLLVLCGVIVFGILGFLLLDKKTMFGRSDSTPIDDKSNAREDGVVESTLDTEEDEDEEDEEDDEEEEDDELNSFKLLVEEALSSIPPELQTSMENLVVLVENEPGDEVLRRVGTKEGYTLLGLYQGVPLTASGRSAAMLPEQITIFQRPIEAYCHGDPERIREQVRRTVLHELAHHFGIDHDEMPIWIK